MRAKLLSTIAMMIVLAACGEQATMPEQAAVGPSPKLPPPHQTLLPTVKIAPVKRWANGAKPTAAQGLQVQVYADKLEHPRWLYALPNGDVLIAETNAPHRPDDNTGIRGWITTLVMGQVGAETPSANRITLIRDGAGGRERSVFAEGLNSPFGMALVGGDFYVANTDAVVRFAYSPGQTRLEGKGTKIAGLPGGTLNHHWTKGLVANGDGSKLYASIGSNSNVGENGLDKEVDRARIIEIDPTSGQSRPFATGLRNPVGMAFDTASGTLWTVVNERDELGSDLVPDYLTSVKDGAFYGWPHSYYGQHVDSRVEANPQLVAKAIAPDYALGNHVAPLGLAFATGTELPAQFQGGVFVAEHGSWNRDPPSGYRVVFVKFENGRPVGQPAIVLSGFLDAEGNARGRPVGLAIDAKGALLVADDVGNVVWRVTSAQPQSAMLR